MCNLSSSCVVLAWGACCLVATAGSARGQEPDPLALLRGVEQSRVQLSGNLRMTVVYHHPLQMPKPGLPKEIEVEFDRDRRRFVIHQTILMIDPPNQEAKSQRYTALKYDIEAARREKLGRVLRVRERAAFDGKQLAFFNDEMGSAEIIDHKKGAGFSCFDLRILGISPDHNVSRTFDGCFGFGEKNTVSLVGREEMAGRTVWHVKVSYPSLDYHFWIEDTGGFRVHRFEFMYPADGSDQHVVARSEYGTGRERPPLPIRVVREEKSGGKLTEIETIDVTEANYNTEPDEDVFGLAGLDLPPGMRVIDARIARVIGFWNGSGLSEDRKEALQLAAEQIAAEVKPRSRGWILWVALGAVAVLVATVGYRRFARRPAAA